MASAAWTSIGTAFYPIPGPGFQGDPGAEENPYCVWVDQHDILGLGANVPIATGNQSDSLHALVGGRVVELRVPYPMRFFAKGIDGRIDDPNASWKGRGLWVTSGNRTPFHIEGIDAPGAPCKTPATYSAPSGFTPGTISYSPGAALCRAGRRRPSSFPWVTWEMWTF